MTSADVKFSIEKVVMPYHSRGRRQFRQLEAIETPDPHTVVFKLKGPQPVFPQGVPGRRNADHAEAPDRHAQYADLASSALRLHAEADRHGPVPRRGNGRAATSCSSVIPQYWREGQPYLDRLIMRVIPDDTARVIAMEKGEVDVAVYGTLPETDIERLTRLPHIKSIERGHGGDRPGRQPDSEPARQAHGRPQGAPGDQPRDRPEGVVDVIWYGQAQARHGPIVPGNPIFDTTLPPYQYDLGKANTLLDEAGYKRGAERDALQAHARLPPLWRSVGAPGRVHEAGAAADRHRGRDPPTDMGGWLKLVYTDWDFQATSVFGNNYADPTIGAARYFISSNIKKGATFTNSPDTPTRGSTSCSRRRRSRPTTAKRKAMYDEAQAILYEELPVLQLIEMATTTCGTSACTA